MVIFFMEFERKIIKKDKDINPMCIKDNNMNHLCFFDTNNKSKKEFNDGFKIVTKLKRNFK